MTKFGLLTWPALLTRIGLISAVTLVGAPTLAVIIKTCILNASSCLLRRQHSFPLGRLASNIRRKLRRKLGLVFHPQVGLVVRPSRGILTVISALPMATLPAGDWRFTMMASGAPFATTFSAGLMLLSLATRWA